MSVVTVVGAFDKTCNEPEPPPPPATKSGVLSKAATNVPPPPVLYQVVVELVTWPTRIFKTWP